MEAIAAQATPDMDDRVLILAPRGRDALVAADLLQRSGIAAEVVADLPALAPPFKRAVYEVLAQSFATFAKPAG